MLRPPLFRFRVRVVPKLNLALGLVGPLIRIVVIWIDRCTLVRLWLVHAHHGGSPDRRRVPYPPSHVLPHFAQRHLHRRSHLSISVLLFRTVRKMKDVLV